jgi:hypothetical protein
VEENNGDSRSDGPKKELEPLSKKGRDEKEEVSEPGEEDNNTAKGPSIFLSSERLKPPVSAAAAPDSPPSRPVVVVPFERLKS